MPTATARPVDDFSSRGLFHFLGSKTSSRSPLPIELDPDHLCHFAKEVRFGNDLNLASLRSFEFNMEERLDISPDLVVGEEMTGPDALQSRHGC